MFHSVEMVMLLLQGAPLKISALLQKFLRGFHENVINLEILIQT